MPDDISRRRDPQVAAELRRDIGADSEENSTLLTESTETAAAADHTTETSTNSNFEDNSTQLTTSMELPV